MRLLVFLFVAAPLALSAQPLTTDRPDFTESPTAVAPGRLQLEVGVTLQPVSFSARDTELTLPEALLRIGVVPGLEARVMAPEYTRVRFRNPEGETTGLEGFGDPSVGFKAEVWSGVGAAVGVIAQASLPVGDDEFSSGRMVPGVIVTGSLDLTPTLSFGAQVGTEIFGEDNGPFAGSATVGGTLVLNAALNDRAGAFAELALEDVIGGVVNPSALVHTGATLLVSPNTQLDAHAGIGLASYAPDYLVGVGASVRL